NPMAALIADLFAIHARGQNALEPFYAVLQSDNTFSDAQSSAQLIGIVWFANEIVGPGRHRFQIFCFSVDSGYQDDVTISRSFGSTNPAAQFEPVGFRHQAIGYNDGKLFLLENAPAFFAITGSDHVVAVQLQCDFEHVPRIEIVFNNENLHQGKKAIAGSD